MNKVLNLFLYTIVGGVLGVLAYKIMYYDLNSMLTENIPGSVRGLAVIDLEEAKDQYTAIGCIAGFLKALISFFKSE